MNLFRKKTKFKVPPDAPAIIEAFHDGDKQCYQFEDIFRTPYKRALGALSYYEELRMRMSREFLQADCAAHRNLNNDIMKILSGESGRINIVSVINLLNKSNELLDQKEQRLNWIIEPDLLYKLASVVFFDEGESPFSYDMKYAQAKIERWKKNKTVTDFFYQEPILKLVPYLAQSKGDMTNSLMVIARMGTIHLDNMYGLLSKDQRETDLGKNLLSLKATLQGYLN